MTKEMKFWLDKSDYKVWCSPVTGLHLRQWGETGEPKSFESCPHWPDQKGKCNKDIEEYYENRKKR